MERQNKRFIQIHIQLIDARSALEQSICQSIVEWNDAATDINIYEALSKEFGVLQSVQSYITV